MRASGSRGRQRHGPDTGVHRHTWWSNKDGCRAQLRYHGRRVRVRSRPGRDCTAEFPELAAIATALAGRRVIIDGELVCLDREGRPDFAALRARLGLRSGSRSTRVAPATLVCFDVLHLSFQ